MVSFADDDWFRGLICSMIALGCILVGYATYYQVLEPRWPDYSTCKQSAKLSLKTLIDGDDEEDEDDQLTTGKENEAYAQEEKPTEKVEEYSETKENGDVNFDF